MHLVSDDIEEYILQHTKPESELLRELAQVTKQSREDAGMMVGPVEGAFLKMLVALSGAKRILEIGMFTGYSALSMAEALPADGTLITCDIDPSAEKTAKKYFSRSPQGSKIEVRMGPALETLKTLKKESFDLIFVDADKENYPHYYDNALPLLRRGGLLVADNCLWSGRVLKPEAPSDHALVAFNKKVQADSAVENVLLSVRDGVMLVRKK